MSFKTFDQIISDRHITSLKKYLITDDNCIVNIAIFFKDDYFWIILGLNACGKELFIVRFDEFLFIIAALKRNLYYSEYNTPDFPIKRKIYFTLKNCQNSILTKIIIEQNRIEVDGKYFLASVIETLFILESRINADLKKINNKLYRRIRNLPWNVGIKLENNPRISNHAIDFGNILSIYSLNDSRTFNIYIYFERNDLWVGIDHYETQFRDNLFILRFDEFLIMLGDFERKLFSSKYETPGLNREMSLGRIGCFWKTVNIIEDNKIIDHQGFFESHIEKMITIKSRIERDFKEYILVYLSIISEFAWSESATDEVLNIE